jgi:DNA-directed RNA polymerase subunit omega
MTDKKDEKDEKGDHTEVDSKYRLIQVAAKRARQLQGGARPQVNTETTKPTKVAMEEVKAGKVEWSVVDKRKKDEPAGEAPGASAGEKPSKEKPETKSEDKDE